MKPILLHGHERAITQIKYNREGDLLFSSAKDSSPNVWYSHNGERLGTFDGHTGAVWTLDVDWQTINLLTGAADSSLCLWNCETGNSPPVMIMPVRQGVKVTSLIWGPQDEFIVTGHENGDIVQWDMRTSKQINMVSEHSDSINDMQSSLDCTMFITASKDTTARLFDTDTLECLKVYKTERPVNSAAISPIFPHVVLGGGQEAMSVTTTSTREGKFEARFYHLIFEEEFGRVKGHFGPINSCTFHPDGRSYSSGGEDGYVRMHFFDQSYFDFKFDY